jgi:hypothetical protein
MDGLPSEFYTRLRWTRTRYFCIWLALGVGAGLLIWGTLFRAWSDGWVVAAVLLSAVFLYFSGLVLIWLRTDWERCVRILPYFDASVPAVADTFWSGFALARHCTALDEIATRLRVTPLSAFGFEDDFSASKARWYEAGDAVRTVEALIERVREQPGVLGEPEAVLADLERIGSRLREAQRTQSRFCFHLRIEEFVSPMEFDRRSGQY